MSATRTIMMLALSLPLLSGCHSMFGSNLTVRPTSGVTEPGAGADYATAQLEAGRKALDEGQLSAAITAFRNARLYPDQAAAASNGLAVAYSQLGRPDLAERYFQQAMAMAPGDKRYQANLQRFYRLNPVEVAMSASDLPAARPTASPAPPTETRMRLTTQAGTPTTVTVSRPESRLVRLSSSEVRLGGGAAAQAVSVTKGPSSAEYPVRLSLRPREVFVGAAAPVRVTTPQAGTSVRVAARPEYPVRLKLQSR